jgi:7,8-dihydro-6-hydroxymethylpterin-pyrophosphokinase
VAGTIDSNISASELIQRLKAIESETHRDKQHVTIDLDLMLYNSQRFHEQDWPQPYIQQIINDIL